MLLIQDPRWLPFVARYAHDLPRFAMEVCGLKVTWQQLELYRSVMGSGSRTSVSSGHGTGKTLAISVIATWHLLCHYSVQNKGSLVILTAPKIEQVRNLAWKEITALQERVRQGPQGWIADYYVVEAERVYIRGFKMTWFVTAKTAPRGSPENLAGFHGEWMLIIADEASGIPDPNYSTLTGALTDGRNRMLLTSQPTRPAGFFYETHHGLSMAEGGVWNALVFNSEESPLVDKKWLSEKAAEYGGTDTEEYAIKVRGQFPEKSSKYLIGRRAIEACFSKKVIKDGEAFGWFILVDVAAGEYRDKSVVIVAKVTGFSDFGPDARRMQVVSIPVCSNSIQPDILAGEVHNLATSLDNATVLVDAGGMGILFAKQLEAFDTPNLVKVKWGNPCFQRRHKERFINQRAQAVVGSRDAVRDHRIGFDPDAAAYKSTILDQGSRIPYGYDEKARYQIARKGSKEWEGLPSPDLWDAISFGFLADAHFIIAEDMPMGTDPETGAPAASNDTVTKADDYFAAA